MQMIYAKLGQNLHN